MRLLDPEMLDSGIRGPLARFPFGQNFLSEFRSLRSSGVWRSDPRPPGSPEVENDREILVPLAARSSKMGHDELLINSLKTALVWERRHSSVGRAADL